MRFRQNSVTARTQECSRREVTLERYPASDAAEYESTATAVGVSGSVSRRAALLSEAVGDAGVGLPHLGA